MWLAPNKAPNSWCLVNAWDSSTFSRVPYLLPAPGRGGGVPDGICWLFSMEQGKTTGGVEPGRKERWPEELPRPCGDSLIPRESGVVVWMNTVALVFCPLWLWSTLIHMLLCIVSSYC